MKKTKIILLLFLVLSMFVIMCSPISYAKYVIEHTQVAARLDIDRTTTKTYEENATENINITDLSENENVEEVSVQNIDKNAHAIELVSEKLARTARNIPISVIRAAIISDLEARKLIALWYKDVRTYNVD